MSRFSDANEALVSENDRLRGSTDVVKKDYAVLLDEIEGLHRKMGALELMVKAGKGCEGAAMLV